MIYMMKAACPRPVLNEYERQRSMSLVPLLLHLARSETQGKVTVPTGRAVAVYGSATRT